MDSFLEAPAISSATCTLGTVTMLAPPRTTIPVHSGGHNCEAGETTMFAPSEEEIFTGATASSLHSSRARPSKRLLVMAVSCPTPRPLGDWFATGRGPRHLSALRASRTGLPLAARRPHERATTTIPTRRHGHVVYESSQFRAGIRAPAVGKLNEAQHTDDPVHLVRLFGIHPGVAVKYVQTAHPDKALPRIRRPGDTRPVACSRWNTFDHVLDLVPAGADARHPHTRLRTPSGTRGGTVVGRLPGTAGRWPGGRILIRSRPGEGLMAAFPEIVAAASPFPTTPRSRGKPVVREGGQPAH